VCRNKKRLRCKFCLRLVQSDGQTGESQKKRPRRPPNLSVYCIFFLTDDDDDTTARTLELYS